MKIGKAWLLVPPPASKPEFPLNEPSKRTSVDRSITPEFGRNDEDARPHGFQNDDGALDDADKELPIATCRPPYEPSPPDVLITPPRIRSLIEEHLSGESAEEDRHRCLDLPLLTKIDDEPRFDVIFA